MRGLLALGLLALAAAASALGFDDIQVWAGTGVNRAAFVADWNDGKSPESLVWGFRWDGVATGATMLRALTAADPRLFATYGLGGGVLFGLGYDLNGNGGGYATGVFPNDVGYPLDPADHYKEGWNRAYWAYYVADGTTTLPTAWRSSGSGFASRTLKDGSWDGWSFAPGFAATAPSVPVPATPVPEPASLAALALGAWALRRQRR